MIHGHNQVTIMWLPVAWFWTLSIVLDTNKWFSGTRNTLEKAEHLAESFFSIQAYISCQSLANSRRNIRRTTSIVLSPRIMNTSSSYNLKDMIHTWLLGCGDLFLARRLHVRRCHCTVMESNISEMKDSILSFTSNMKPYDSQLSFSLLT